MATIVNIGGGASGTFTETNVWKYGVASGNTKTYTYTVECDGEYLIILAGAGSNNKGSATLNGNSICSNVKVSEGYKSYSGNCKSGDIIYVSIYAETGSNMYGGIHIVTKE